VLAAGLVPERFAEGGRPTPVVLAMRARKPLEPDRGFVRCGQAEDRAGDRR
jgi:hypothetical protein